jgi:hypothetical protein
LRHIKRTKKFYDTIIWGLYYKSFKGQDFIS